jgi:hypothetical protein
MDQTSRVSRRPAPPVILYRDNDWAKPLDPPKLWIPDSTTLEIFLPTTVTWYFENIEDYTAEPYVAEVPRVDFLGRTDRKSKALLFEAFYLYGLQLIPDDLELMEREDLSLVRLVDDLIKWETADAENVFTRVFDRKNIFKGAGLMWLPFLHGSGLSARLGYTPGPAFEPLPVYPGLNTAATEPPPYVQVEDADTDSADDVDEDDESVVDEPPSYEYAVDRATIVSIGKPRVSIVGVHVNSDEDEADIVDVHVDDTENEFDSHDRTESKTQPEPEAQGVDAARAKSSTFLTPTPQAAKPPSRSGRWLRRVRDLFRKPQIASFRSRFARQHSSIS